MMPGHLGRQRRRGPELHAKQLLAEVGLEHRITHRPGELSGGEQQRVALARALVQRPQLLLADEPTGNLDSTTSRAIHQLFFEINRKFGTTVVIVTHNVEFAQAMPRVITLRDGLLHSDAKQAVVAREPAADNTDDLPSGVAHEQIA
jgi:lipoprotein-releasing system ATP-binding protein